MSDESHKQSKQPSKIIEPLLGFLETDEVLNWCHEIFQNPLLNKLIDPMNPVPYFVIVGWSNWQAASVAITKVTMVLP